MDISHVYFRDSITKLKESTRKGVPWASREKERKIRRVLNCLEDKLEQPPTFSDVWFYFKMWLACVMKRKYND